MLTHVRRAAFHEDAASPAIALWPEIPVHLGPLRIRMGSIRHVSTLVRHIKRALTTARISSSRGAHPVWGEITSLISSHTASVRSEG